MIAKSGTISSLRKPVLIPGSIYFAETNLKAIDLLKVIKKLFDKFDINCSNIFINYIGSILYSSSNNDTTTISSTIAVSSDAHDSETGNENNNPDIELIKNSLVSREKCFVKWLISDKKSGVSKAWEILNNAKHIERMAIRANLKSYKIIYTYNSEIVEKTKEEIINTTHYLIKDDQRAEGLSAIELYIEFLKNTFSSDNTEEINISTDTNETVVITSKSSESHIDYKKLKEMSKYSLKDRKKAFVIWIKFEKKYSELQAEQLINSIKNLERLVFKARLKHNDILFTSDIETVRCTKSDILASNDPLLIYESKEDAMKALDLYIEFLEVVFNKSKSKMVEPIQKEIVTSDNEEYYSKTEKEFFNWLLRKCELSEITAKNYISKLQAAEKMAMLQRFPYNKLISTLNYGEAFKTYTLLKANSLFSVTNTKAHNQYTAAINNYLQFLVDLPQLSVYDTLVKPEKTEIGSQDIAPDIQKIDNRNTEPHNIETSAVTNPVVTSYQNVLRQKFKKGFRISSALDLRKFKALYEEIEGKSLSENDETIKRNISECGIVYDEKLYLIDDLLSEEIKNKLFAYIEKTFSSGKNAIYYDALFEEFKDDFSCERIFDSKMLMLYLKETLKGKYHYTRTYISQELFVKVEFDTEIMNCLMEHGTPVLTETICNELSHIPQDKIRQVLSTNGDFIRNSKGEYFHCSLINFSEKDLENIASIINNAIREKEYISGNELIDSIQKKYPHIIDNNEVLSPLGLRGAIAYSLQGKFSFDSNVISKYGESLSMANVYADYSKSRESFTIDELRLLKNELQSGIIYFEAVYANSLRISQDTFVSRNNACFNVPSTDSAIDMFMNGMDYMPLKDISSFGSFPNAGFPWNIYLLEHYVAEFSDKFKLIHNTYNEGNCVGAIVRKDSNINSFDELVAISLAESGTILTENNALEFLCNSGYLAVRRYKGTAQAIIKAIEIRNKKGKN